MILVNGNMFTDGGAIARHILTTGLYHESRLGISYEILNATISAGGRNLIYRLGMSKKLGMVETLQFFSGYFDERHHVQAAPKLLYPYGIHQAYGMKVAQQIPRVIEQLKIFPETRRAIIHIGKPEDGQEQEKPCIQSLQFMIRQDRLVMTVYVRSWDAIAGLPTDFVVFAGIHQIIAALLPGVVTGVTTVHAASLHVYQHALDRMNTINPDWMTAPIKFNGMALLREFHTYDDLREWAIDELNSIDKWKGGMPSGWESYYA